MLHSIAMVIRNGIDNKLLASPFVSLFIDESTDIAVHKKLAVYACVLDPKTFEPSTHFVTNVRLEYGSLQTSVRNRLSICLAALEKDKRKEDLYRLTTGEPFQLKQT